MAADSIEEILEHWYKKLGSIPETKHLLCPKVDDDDSEDYSNLSASLGDITFEEKKKRVEEGKERLEIASWNSILFGYDRDKAGVWLTYYSDRMSKCLSNCDKCVLNWHNTRKSFLQKFSEYVSEQPHHSHIIYYLARRSGSSLTR
jgi:senataxin